VAEDEYLLKSEEELFYGKYGAGAAPLNINICAQNSLSSSPHRPAGPDAFSSLKITNPLYDYETKVGRAKVLRETLDNMRFEQEQDLQMKSRLESLGQEMDPVDAEFLDTFEATFNANVTELRQVENEILRLEEDAIKAGLLHPSAAYSSFVSQLASPLPLPATATESHESHDTTPEPKTQEPKTQESMMPKFKVEKQDGGAFLTMRNALHQQVAERSSEANVEHWLRSIPILGSMERVLRITPSLVPQGSSAIPGYHTLTNWLYSGRRKRLDSTEATSKMPTTSSSPNHMVIDQGPFLEPYSKPIPQHATLTESQDAFCRLDGVGQWFRLSGLSTPSIHDWEHLSSSPEIGADTNNQRYRYLKSFLRILSLGQSEANSLERPKTLGSQPPQPQISHSTPMNMEMDNQESRSI
jgi:hypothetical protein